MVILYEKNFKIVYSAITQVFYIINVTFIVQPFDKHMGGWYSNLEKSCNIFAFIKEKYE